jgi:hypothetical protein
MKTKLLLNSTAVVMLENDLGQRESSKRGFHTGAASDWRRARRWTTAGVGTAIGLLLALGAAPASANVTDTYTFTDTVLRETETFAQAVTIDGSTPASVAADGTVSMTGFQFHFTIPAAMVNQWLKYGGRSISGTCKTIDINATDAKTATVNAAGPDGIAISRINLQENKAVTITVPASADTEGTWTASKKGTMRFDTGDIDFTLELGELGGGVIASIKFTGKPSPAATISETTVK